MKTISSGFIIIDKNKNILLGKTRSNNDLQWTVFKGRQEDGETLIQAAIRELYEETGIDLVNNHRLNRYVSGEPVFSYSMKYKDVYLYLLEDVESVLEDFNFECNSFWGDDNLIPEIEEYKWVPIKDCNDYLLYSQQGVGEFLKEKYNEIR
jgi:8-oxo-dGTP pyrophosphatase MutT (NUDIX family)